MREMDWVGRRHWTANPWSVLSLCSLALSDLLAPVYPCPTPRYLVPSKKNLSKKNGVLWPDFLGNMS